MSQTLEAKLYHTIRSVNDLTKANANQAIFDAIKAGSINLDERSIRGVLALVSGVVDQSSDLLHTQVTRTVNENAPVTSKKKSDNKKSSD